MAIIPGTGAGAEQLTQFIERIERLEEEKRALMADIRDVYSEAKATGFEPKIMRQIVRPIMRPTISLSAAGLRAVSLPPALARMRIFQCC